jgi:hypothetical protein
MMSSATSIERNVGLKAEATQSDAGFKPWHFFVLVSLAASTVAVLMSRRASPEHLILLSFTIGAAGVAAAAFYRTLAPLALRDVSLLSERPTERALAALEREKALVLRSIKELEFDRAMGKVSTRDFDEMAGRLRARAVMLMKQLDEGGSVYRELIERELRARLTGAGLQAGRDSGGAGLQAGLKCSCGTASDPDAAFCKRCGTKLEAVHS